jgi:hypothetical protein
LQQQQQRIQPHTIPTLEDIESIFIFFIHHTELMQSNIERRERLPAHVYMYTQPSGWLVGISIGKNKK